MQTIMDKRGRSLSLSAPPQRIVSLVPSTTETLFSLGCGDRVVGVTRFCVHPSDRLGGIAKVGGTKTLDEDRLRALRPDLVLGNAEENTREIFGAVDGICPLYVSFPRDVDGALEDLLAVGALTGCRPQAQAWHARIVAARGALSPRPFTYAYLIWRKPWMAVSGETFISAMLSEAGGENVFAAHSERYFSLTPEALAEAGPDVVFLSSEPFPFKDRHREELAAATGLPPDRFALVDGEYCSWHGVRMAEAFGYLAGRPWSAG
jgi:ABC-type Fe3+-hydroxamate transport system substrate-binding protein